MSSAVSDSSSDRRYRSRVDLWFFVLLLLALAALLAGAFPLFLQDSGVSIAFVAALVGLTLSFPSWLALSTHYTLTSTSLRVRSGPLKWDIPLASIRGVRLTNDMAASPALSLDRIRIDYGRGSSVLISPAEKREFMQDLAGRRERIRANSR